MLSFKRIFFSLLVAAIFTGSPAFARAEEHILSFDTAIAVKENADLFVTETIQYDFETANKHGIFRNIPFSYKTKNGNFRVRLSDISVTGKNGLSLPFTTAEEDGLLRIQIGDPDSMVSGINIYVIRYTASRAIAFFNDRDEIYWNTTGNDWAVPIASATASVSLPSGAPGGTVTAACYAGTIGSTLPCQIATLNIDKSGEANGATFANGSLASGQGMTVALSFPKGITIQMPLWKRVLFTLEDNSVFGLPVATILFFVLLWQKVGRDPKGRGTIIAEYGAPDGVSPAAAGTIIDERVNPRDTIATIIDLARRGFLKITRIPKKIPFFSSDDYQFDRFQELRTLTNSYEKEIFSALFPNNSAQTTLSEMRKKSEIRKKFLSAENALYKQLVESGYFPKNPKTVRGAYTAGSIAFGYAAFFFLGNDAATVASILASVAIAVFFSLALPVRTRKGVRERERILGLKEYITIAEKDRLRFHDAPEKSPERFSEILPYAIALGIEKAWAAQFGDLSLQPNWYGDGEATRFSAAALAGSMHDFSTSASRILSSHASGGGSGISGGSSGGGFGGGGGGSW